MEGTIEIKWFKIRLWTIKFPEEDEDKKEKIEEEDEKLTKTISKFSWKDFKKTISLLIQARVFLLKFFKMVVNSFNLELFKVHIILGLTSPADTASTLGCMWGAASILNIHPKFDFNASPDFKRERIDGNLALMFNIQLLKPIAAIIWLLTKKPVLLLIWNLRKY